MKKVLKEILSTSLYLLIVLCLTYIVIHFVGQRTQVIGGSMETTLSENDNLIVDKLTYRFREPKRFDFLINTEKILIISKESSVCPAKPFLSMRKEIFLSTMNC